MTGVRALVRRRPLWLLAVLLVAGLALVVFRTTGDVQESQAQQSQLQTIADPLAQACADPTIRARLGEAACTTAQAVTSAAAPPVDGQAGAAGEAGRGIVGTSIGPDGRLVVTYSDGSRMDAGPVAERPGSDGRGITRSGVVDGRLIVTYTDGRTENLGPVLGERGAAGDAGRGIVGVAVQGGRLVVTFSDGATEDAGEVPVGPMGPQGPRGEVGEPGDDAELPAQYTRTFTDGTSETCTRANSDDTSPVWSCTDRA